MEWQTFSPSDLRKLGLEALSKALGPVGMARFLQQFESGAGDYTKEGELAKRQGYKNDCKGA